MFLRRDQCTPGMTIKSSHGYKLLLTKVLDDATQRSEDRHVEFVGFLHGNTAQTRNERYPACGLVEVVGMPERACQECGGSIQPYMLRDLCYACNLVYVI